ncbi:hypothetical protein FA15DRAFT_658131 [Coprinopsis marcescibilis]|uniref:Mediator of RNA polymerase II transcription subunit 25 n=1 Tax=Coprinopsis marcescibilis TaxID=230819 RepID=A0A5C3KNL1_COPMA|nr:hypothetical protein FA15DRAFT_658131 [Coprinopsis marcescibilis]
MIQNLFLPRAPCRASVVLFLIENSAAMSRVWPTMRDVYLEPLLKRIDRLNTLVPINVLALETVPSGSSGSRPAPQAHSTSHGLEKIKFHNNPDTRISTAKVDSAIDIDRTAVVEMRQLLASIRFEGQPVTGHLIVVAASAPVDNPLLGIQQYAWFLLADKLTQANAFCHLVLAPSKENMGSLIGLFDKTVFLQKNVDIPLPAHATSASTGYILKFCNDPKVTLPSPSQPLENTKAGFQPRNGSMNSEADFKLRSSRGVASSWAYHRQQGQFDGASRRASREDKIDAFSGVVQVLESAPWTS